MLKKNLKLSFYRFNRSRISLCIFLRHKPREKCVSNINPQKAKLKCQRLVISAFDRGLPAGRPYFCWLQSVLMLHLEALTLHFY